MSQKCFKKHIFIYLFLVWTSRLLLSGAKKEVPWSEVMEVLQWRAASWKRLINRDADNYPWTVQISFA